jgi:hypothetical protein
MEAKIKYLCIGFLVALNMDSVSAQTGDAVYAHVTPFNWAPVAYNIKTKADRVKEVMQNNELEGNGILSTGCNNIWSNPLLLDGKTLDYGTFALESKGVLSVEKATASIPFYISIRRNGNMIEDKKMLFLNKPLYKVNVSDIFPHCKQGDMLIIKPVRAEDWQMKRILKLIHDGC